METKIITINLFDEQFEIDLQDIDLSIFELFEEIQEPKTDTIEDIIKLTKILDKIMLALIGDKFKELMQNKKRSIKTYMEIANALKDAME